MEENINYEQDVSIDETALDVEWLGQSRVMMKYGVELANAIQEHDKAKEQLEMIKAELDLEIRANPQEFVNENITKITEAVITNTILIQKSYKDAVNKTIEKKHEMEVLKGAVKAVDGRKTALENLVKLHGQQYFAGPSVPRDLSKEWEQKQNQSESNKRIKIKRTRR